MYYDCNFSHTSTNGFQQKKQVRDDEVGVFAGGKFDKSLRWWLPNADCKPNYKRDEHKETLNIKTSFDQSHMSAFVRFACIQVRSDEVKFVDLDRKTGHYFLIWKVMRRVGNDRPKPACCYQGDSALTSSVMYRYDYNFVPQLYFTVCIIHKCDLSEV